MANWLSVLMLSVVWLVPEAISATCFSQSPPLRKPWVNRAATWELPSDQTAASNAPFIIRSDASTAQVRALTREIFDTRAAIEALLGSIPLLVPEHPALFVFSDRAEMAAVARTHLGLDHTMESLRVDALYAQLPEAQVIATTTNANSALGGAWQLRKAAVAQYLAPRFGNHLPRWAQTGIEAYFASLLPSFNGRTHEQLRSAAPPAFLLTLQAANERSALLPVDRLLSLDNAQWNRIAENGGEALLRAQSWALVHLFLHGLGNNGQEAFRLFLQRVATRADPTETLIAILDGVAGSPDDALDRAAQAHIESLVQCPILRALEDVELLQVTLEALEKQGIRINTIDELRQALAGYEPADHVFSSWPVRWSRRLGPATTIDLTHLAFEANNERHPNREARRLEPPLDIVLRDVPGYHVAVHWLPVPDTDGWQPVVRVSTTRQ